MALRARRRGSRGQPCSARACMGGAGAVGHSQALGGALPVTVTLDGGAGGPDCEAVLIDSLRNLSIQPDRSVARWAAAVRNAAAETTRAPIWLALMQEW